MAEEKKTYKLKMDIEILSRESYSQPELKIKIEENIPKTQEPDRYLRLRLKEELDRHTPHCQFDQPEGGDFL